MKENARYLQLVGYTRGCPAGILTKARHVVRQKSDIAYTRTILAILAKEFSPTQYVIATTRNFSLSRFVPVRKILQIRLATCGAMATVVASVFRSLGFPTKMVNGWLGEKSEGRRHAWNEIYLPSLHRFVPFDITRKTFRVGRRHRKKDEWVDWSDLKKVYYRTGKSR